MTKIIAPGPFTPSPLPPVPSLLSSFTFFSCSPAIPRKHLPFPLPPPTPYSFIHFPFLSHRRYPIPSPRNSLSFPLAPLSSSPLPSFLICSIPSTSARLPSFPSRGYSLPAFLFSLVPAQPFSLLYSPQTLLKAALKTGCGGASISREEEEKMEKEEKEE